MKVKVAKSIQEAEQLLEDARKLVNSGQQPLLCFEGSHVGIAISHPLAKDIFRETERQLIKLKKANNHVH